MANSVMLGLGDYRFSLETAAYQQFQQSTSYLWPEQQRFGRETSLQFLGQGVKEINLSGVIYPEYRGGFSQLRHMEAEAQKGVPLLLFTGTGKVLGLWVILSISETGSIFRKNGAARKVEFSLKLKYYGPSQQTSVSVNNNSPVSASNTNASSLISSVLNRLAFLPANIENAFRSLGIELHRANGSLRDIADIINDIQSVATDFDAGSQLSLMRDLLGDEVANSAASNPNDVFQGAKSFFDDVSAPSNFDVGDFF